MKKSLILCLIGLLSLGNAAWTQAQQTGATEKAVAGARTTVASVTKDK